MHRILFCLPVCLCLASDRLDVSTQAEPTALVCAAVAEVQVHVAALPDQDEMERLAKEDVIAFLENVLRRYAADVKGYTVTLQKQEFMDGRLLPTEVIDVCFNDKPHSVLFVWQQGARLAERALFVEGENDGKMLARPRGGVARLVAGDIVARDVAGSEARQSGRYPLNEFGFKKSTERTLRAWKAGRDDGDLQVEFQGVKKLKELGERPAWALRRVLKQADKDGVKEATITIDTETWLQVGNVLKDSNGQLLGAYYFRDVRLNPEFKKDQFGRQALRP